MKKVFLMFASMMVTAVVFGQSDTVVVAEPGGFWGIYSKYSVAFWMILSTLGVAGFVSFRASKIRDAFNEIVKAGEDKHVTEEEFQAILKALKAIWGKKE